MTNTIPLKARPFLFPTLLLVFTLFGGLKVLSPILMPFREANQQFIEQAVTDTSHLLIPLGLAKAGADMIEGSTFAVEGNAFVAKSGLTIQIGDTVQPLLDCIDFAWKTLLVSLTGLLIVRALFPVLPELAQPLLIITLAFHLAGLLFPAVRYRFRNAAAFFLMSFFTVWLLIPLSITGTAHLSTRVTTGMRQHVNAYFQELGSVFSVESITAANGFVEHAGAIKDKFDQIRKQSAPLARKAPAVLTELLAMKLLNGLIFPVLTGFFLYRFLKFVFADALRDQSRTVVPDARLP